MKILATTSLLLLLGASLLANAQSDPRLIQAEDKYLRPVLVVPPVFPKREVTDKLPVEIRVSGSVTETGTMESVEFSPIEGNEKFIQAIKDVLPHWRIRPAVDEKLCAPVAGKGVMLVWFEEKNGAPSVSVSARKPEPESVPVDGVPRAAPRTLVVRPKVDFPIAAQRAGMEGSAELLLKTNHQGELLQATVLFSIPHKVFGDEARAGSRRSKFSVGAPDEDAQKTLCIILPFKFCLTSFVNYPSPVCAKE
jgi:TonB family protein